MIDFYLRADTESDLVAALQFARRDTEWVTATKDYALDLIGPVVITEGTYREDGVELTPPVIDTRFHANLRCAAEIAALVPASIKIAPHSPSRVWA